jgi:hypothetical protein
MRNIATITPTPIAIIATTTTQAGIEKLPALSFMMEYSMAGNIKTSVLGTLLPGI